MKKIFTSLLLLTAMAVTANAEMTTVWKGTHSTLKWQGLNQDAAQYSSLKAGDNITFSVKPDTENAPENEKYYQLQVKSWDNNGIGTNITTGEGDAAEVAIDKEQDYTVTLTEVQADAIKAHGFTVNGHYIIITKIFIDTEENGEITPPDTPEEGTTTEIWKGNCAPTIGEDGKNGWTQLEELAWKNDFANAKIDDVITVTFTTSGDYADITIANVRDGYNAFDDNSTTTLTVKNEEQTFNWTIPNVEILEDIQECGVVIKGNNLTITKIELTTYPESYDAVAVTIDTEGIATYSKSYKAIDFTNTNVKAYYASAIEKGKVTLTPINQVPESTGIIVKGEPGTHEIPVIDKIDGLETNYLKAVGDWDGTITASTDEIYHYSFTETAAPTFSLVTKNTDIPAHKAYLETPTDITPKTGSIKLVFTDDTSTGINEIETEVQESGDNSYYNLQGMRVEHPTKGIYIHKGKKIIIR